MLTSPFSKTDFRCMRSARSKVLPHRLLPRATPVPGNSYLAKSSRSETTVSYCRADFDAMELLSKVPHAAAPLILSRPILATTPD
uniref:DUF1778 domain-containing protein n=1 Tax=Macrostomum lignano TaxID=282301 RepID=A0A1I8F8V5_9PLAT